ncbi:hypothetical protein KUTeg_001381 [Tegillarca granosa]|uniref:LRP2 EGF-like domain-containing protein n=1 Tax=Tegillarca granosa TaxID=220873 RepID=A0ABQ9FR84_TEGGR|nr:hypothetical protein KUTeg_001381 [Tegillarca granosa]
MYMMHDGITGLSITKGARHNVLPVSSLGGGIDFDFDSQNDTIYASVKAISLKSGNTTDFMPTAFSSSPYSIAIDWISRNMYWTDEKAGTIEVMRMDGPKKYRKILRSNTAKLVNCAQPVVLYWADKGGSGIPSKIASMRMDGTLPNVINQRRVSVPECVALDHDLNVVYWTDSARQWRTQRLDVFKKDLSHPIGIVYHQKKLYYVDAAYESVFVVNDMNNPNDVQIIKNNLLMLSSLKVFYERHTKDRVVLHVDVHMKGQHIYWCDYDKSGMKTRSSNGIRRIKPDGTGYQEIINTGVGIKPGDGIRGLAVDWMAGNLYFTNSRNYETYIEVSRMDGSHRLVLLTEKQSQPRALAVNPVKRYLYWVDNGQYPKIERVSLDVSNSSRVTIVSYGISSPRDIFVDVFTNDVYWVDSVVDAIQKVSFSGGNRQYIRTNLPSPFGLAVDEFSIYWVDRNLKRVFKLDKNSPSTSKPTILKNNLDNLRDITLFNAKLQTSVESSPCAENNGGCEQLCFALPNKTEPKCACSTGNLGADGKSCIAETEILSLSLDPKTKSAPIKPIQGLEGAVAVDFDYKNSYIYFSQVLGKRISRIKNGSTECIPEKL